MNNENKLTIYSFGDAMICDSPLFVSVGVGSKYKKNRDSIIDNCSRHFRDADVVIGNLEAVVHTPKKRSLVEMQMSCSDSVIEDLKQAGCTVLNLANNHCLQHGTEGFQRTKQCCIDNGIVPIGTKNENPIEYVIKGHCIALLSLCIHLEWYQPNNIMYENCIERIANSVRDLKKQGNSTVIIVSVHWGDEFAIYPSNAQIALAHKLVDEGADIILGHHPHVYQGVETYKGAVIAYSQGNFISDMVPEMCRQTGALALQVCFEDDGKKTISYKLIPYYIDENYAPQRDKGEWVNERQAVLCDAIKGMFSDDDYWRMVGHNHSIAHKSFIRFFTKNIYKYNLGISSKMLIEFAGRKMKRIKGTSTDGRVSSMDPEIYSALDKMKETT